MELWFWAAVGAGLFAGVSNFYFKQAAARGYSAELFSLYGGLISIVGIGLLVLYFGVEMTGYGLATTLVFIGGCIAGTTNIFKVLALRFIDSTIYFPLYKLLAPGLAIVIGISVFEETFSLIEWVGLITGLLVPLMLINTQENKRQNNLLLGLLLVVVTGLTSASSAALNKYATDVEVPILAILLVASAGVFVGATAVLVYKSGLKSFVRTLVEETSAGLVTVATLRAVLISMSLGSMLLAYVLGGTLAVVQTIHSMYILIPIVLSIIFYGEHWNLQKAAAIVLSVAALALLG